MWKPCHDGACAMNCCNTPPTQQNKRANTKWPYSLEEEKATLAARATEELSKYPPMLNVFGFRS